MEPSIQAPRAQAPRRENRGFLQWLRRILGVCLVIFAFELGVFLVVFPWLRNWEQSWIPVHVPVLAPIWMSHYFRGALTGVGLLNLYVALIEMLQQVRAAFQRSAT